MVDILKITDFIKMDLDKKGFTFWVLIFGVIITVFSIIYTPEFVLLGILISLYGAVGNLFEVFFDRLIYREMKRLIVGEEDADEHWHQISPLYHIARLVVQLALISVLIILVHNNIEFD